MKVIILDPPRNTDSVVLSSTKMENLILLAQCGNFQKFPATQTIHENSFRDSKSAKSAFLTHLEALNFDFDKSLHFLKAETFQINKIQSLQNCKNGIFFLTFALYSLQN